jgi:uncharacterized integral membrane protein
MAYVTLILAIVFAFLIALFAVQNSMVVNVNLMMWNIEASLVLVILGAALLGFLLALSLQVYSQVKLRYQLYKAKAHIQQLEEELVLAKRSFQQDETIPLPAQNTCENKIK